jgi:hypothetical protein
MSALFWYCMQCRKFLTNITLQPVSPIFKGRAVHEECMRPTQRPIELTEDGDLHSTQVDLPWSV